MEPYVAEVLKEQDTRLPINVFDVVHLKSGGPNMTVSQVDGQKALCRWFDKNRLNEKEFKIGELRRGRHDPVPIISLGGISPEDLGNPPWLRSFEPEQPSKDSE
jgi:uncharacterized protein YodC (DUF2158 family)